MAGELKTQGTINGGGGGFSTQASATGQSDLYEFSQTPTNGGKIVGTALSSGSGTAFVDQRSGSFANDGNPTIEARGTDFEDVLGPNENGTIYIWEREIDTDTNQTPTPGGRQWGITWDGNRFISGDRFGGYLYELDSTFTVTGGTSSPGDQPGGITWDGSRFIHTDINANYIYELDSNLNVTGGASVPGTPTGVTWDNSRFILQTRISITPYLYELDSNLSVTGVTSAPGSFPTGVGWDGTRYYSGDGSATADGYLYLLDSNLTVVGGDASVGGHEGVCWDGGRIISVDGIDGQFNEFAGSYDFMAGIIS